MRELKGAQAKRSGVAADGSLTTQAMRDTALSRDQFSAIKAHTEPTANALVTKVEKATSLTGAKQQAGIGSKVQHFERLVIDSPDHSLRLACAGGCLALLLLVASMGPVINPGAYGIKEGSSGQVVAASLHRMYPLPQAGLAVLLVGSLGLIAYMISLTTEAPQAIKGTVTKSMKALPSTKVQLPDGLTLAADGRTLLDSSGKPLSGGYKLGKDGSLRNAKGHPVPAGFTIGAGGVLLSPEGRPVPHGVSLGSDGVLIAANGRPLPPNIKIGPNGTLIAIDGTVLGPDMLPVPGGFTLSPKGKLLRPNGKPVPMGVFVGKEFVLLTPYGKPLPDGIKIGPNGTVLTPDGAILGADGYPAPRGFALSPDKHQLLGPSGCLVQEAYTLGPNGTLITSEGVLLADVEGAPAPLRLRRDLFTLGPLGSLLLKGKPVPPTAHFTNQGTLVDVVGGSRQQLYPVNPANGTSSKNSGSS